MSHVRLSRVAFSYGGHADIFSDLDLHLDAGWTGVAGANGAGKSTLLSLIAGALEPDAGAILLPPGAAVHLCRQRVDEPEPAIAAFAADWERRACRLRARLDLEPAELDRWSTLSPGERKRWQIGAALAARPDVLLLDEPTNHLDAAAREQLAGALERFAGVGVIVSHDRALLDRLTSATARVAGGGAVLYRGGYSAARAQWEAERAGLERRHDAARSRQRAARARLASARRDHDGARAARSTRKRLKGPRDSDNRSSAAKARARNGEARAGRAVELARREGERADAEVAGIAVDRRRGRSLFVRYEPAPMTPIARLEAAVIGAPPLVRDVSLSVGRESRIRLAGANGAGKTTVLRHLLAAAGDRTGRFLYLPQELSRASAARAIEDAGGDRAGERSVCRSRLFEIVAALGVDPDRLQAPGELSPGERRKVALAAGLARDAWLLLLDEPTNHLDIDSIERLESALIEYPGAIVLVTHDETLASRTTDQTWRIEGGTIGCYSGIG